MYGFARINIIDFLNIDGFSVDNSVGVGRGTALWHARALDISDKLYES